MASNKLPDNLEALFTLAEDMADGLQILQDDVGVKQNRESDIRDAIADGRIAEQNYATARATKKTIGAAQKLADNNGAACIAAARSVLALRYGQNWSEAWLPTGFPDQSTAVPNTIEARQELLMTLHGYFTANPTHANAPLGVTAAQADTLGQALSTARSAVLAAIADSGQKKKLRNAAVTVLRKRMRGLVTELEQLLEDDDPRWSQFGLSMPASANLPDVPDAPTLTAGAPGVISADWDDAARADHYRVFKQVVGTDADFVFVDNPTDSDLTLTGLPTGATVKVAVSAVNDAGESQKSEPAQIVVP